ncbi:MAG: hypothetical protein ABII23_03425 [bacterium]
MKFIINRYIAVIISCIFIMHDISYSLSPVSLRDTGDMLGLTGHSGRAGYSLDEREQQFQVTVKKDLLDDNGRPYYSDFTQIGDKQYDKNTAKDLLDQLARKSQRVKNGQTFTDDNSQSYYVIEGRNEFKRKRVLLHLPLYYQLQEIFNWQSEEEFVSFIAEMVEENKKFNSTKFNKLSTQVLVFFQLDASQFLFENNAHDGFVGVNKVLFEKFAGSVNVRKRKRILKVMLKVGFAHMLALRDKQILDELYMSEHALNGLIMSADVSYTNHLRKTLNLDYDDIIDPLEEIADTFPYADKLIENYLKFASVIGSEVFVLIINLLMDRFYIPDEKIGKEKIKYCLYRISQNDPNNTSRVFKIIKDMLVNPKITSDNVCDIFQELENLSRVAGPMTWHSFSVFTEMLSRPEVNENNVLEVLRSLAGPIGEICWVSGKRADNDLFHIEDIVRRTVISFTDLKNVLWRLAHICKNAANDYEKSQIYYLPAILNNLKTCFLEDYNYVMTVLEDISLFAQTNTNGAYREMTRILENPAVTESNVKHVLSELGLIAQETGENSYAAFLILLTILNKKSINDRNIIQLIPKIRESLIKIYDTLEDSEREDAFSNLNFIIANPRVTDENIIEVLDRLYEISSASCFIPHEAFTLAYAILNKTDMYQKDVEKVLPRLVEPFRKIAVAAGKSSPDAFMAVFQIISNVNITHEKAIQMLPDFAEPFKIITQMSGPQSKHAFKFMRKLFKAKNVPLKQISEVVANLAKPLGIFALKTGKHAETAFDVAQFMIDKNIATHENIERLLTNIAGPLGELCKAAGKDARGLFEKIKSLFETKNVTSINAGDMLTAFIEPVRVISNATGSYSINAYEQMKQIITHPQVNLENMDRVLGLLSRIAHASGRSAPDVYMRIIKFLSGMNYYHIKEQDNMLKVLTALTVIAESAGPAAKEAIRFTEDYGGVMFSLDDRSDQHRDIPDILTDLIEPVAEIRRIAGKFEPYAFQFASQLNDSSGEYPKEKLRPLIGDLALFYDELNSATENTSESVSMLVCNILYEKMILCHEKGQKRNEIIQQHIHLLREKGYKEILKQASGLKSIDFKNNGRAVNNSHVTAERLLENITPLNLIRDSSLQDVSKEPEVRGSCSLRELGENANMQGNLLLSERLLGRKIVFTDEKGDKLVIKFRKQGEPISVFNREPNMFASSDQEPEPIKIGDGYLFKFDMDSLENTMQKKIKKLLWQSMQEAGKKTHMFYIDPQYSAFAYKIPRDSGYDNYLWENEEKEDVKSAVLTAASRLGEMADKNMVHTALIDIFHNISVEDRRYIWSVDLSEIQGGAGCLTSWRLACKWPNIGKNGEIRDWAEVVHMNEVIENPEMFLGKDGEFLVRKYKQMAPNILMLHFLGEYAMALTHMYGDWLLEHEQMPDWDNDDMRKELTAFMKDIYFTLISSYLDKDRREFEEDFSLLVNWDHLSRQIPFFMGADYIPFVDPKKYRRENNFPSNIYSNNVKVRFGNYFSDEVDTFDEIVGFVGNGKGSSVLIRDMPGLGPLNGPYPIQELITANYYLFALAVAEKSIIERNAESTIAETKAQAQSRSIAKKGSAAVQASK